MSRALFFIAACVGLVGCSSTLPTLQTVKVAVPVPCQVTEPQRPVMPTEHLPPRVKLDPFVRAAQAEIGLREGYEGELRAALQACTSPLQPGEPKPP